MTVPSPLHAAGAPTDREAAPTANRRRGALVAGFAAAALVAGTFLSADVPAVAADGPTITGITSGATHSLALDSTGEIYAWGGNAAGQLGDATTTAAPLPKRITDRGAIPAGVQIIQVVATATRSFALGADGKVYGWGSNPHGQLGDGSTTARTAPVAVSQGAIPADVRIVQITAGASATYALGDNGKAYAWGDNSTGILGDGTTTSQTTPLEVSQGDVPTGVELVKIATGETSSHVLALGSNGLAYAWGPGTSGRLGTNSTSASTVPVAVHGGEIPAGVSLVDIGVGTGNSIALGSDGEAYAWGDGLYGALGIGMGSGSRLTPVRVLDGAVPGGVKLVDLTVLARSSVALGDDGRAYSWGHSMYGQIGDGTTANRTTPVAVSQGALPAGVKITAVDGKGNAATVLADDGRAYAWGSNGSNQLGDGTMTSRSVPVLIGFDPAWSTQTAITMSTTGSLVEGASFTVIADLAPATATGTVRFRWDGPTGSFIPGSSPIVAGRAQITATAPAYGSRSIFAEYTSDQPTVNTSATATLPVVFTQSPIPKITPERAQISATRGASSNPGLTLALADGDTPADQLTVTAVSSSSGILSTADIAISGAGATRTVTFVPGAGVGKSTVTFTVRDTEGQTGTTQVTYYLSAPTSSASASYLYGSSDSSAAIDVGDGHILVADDEDQVIRLYERGANGYPVKTFNFQTHSQVSEVDLEGAARRGDTIYWVGSYGNSSSSGEARPERRTTFTTTVTGSGADVELTFGTLYDRSESLFPSLLAWDADNGHGLGADTLKFATATVPGRFPSAPDGFGIEGFEFAPGSTGAGYLSFRAPTITVADNQRALIVPVENFESVITESATPAFGAPILMDLGNRSIRDIRKNVNDEYVILAGPITSQGWAVYTWDGKAGSAPVFNRDLPSLSSNQGGTWETIAGLPDRLATGAPIELVTDSGDAVLYADNTVNKDQPGNARKTYSDTFALGDVPVQTQLTLEASVATRVLAGKAYLTVTVRNADDVAADVRVETQFGAKSFADVAPGATVTVSLNTRAAALPTGVATVTGTGADATEFEASVPFGPTP